MDLQIVSVNIVSDGTYITDLDPSLDTGILLMEVPQKEVVMDFKWETIMRTKGVNIGQKWVKLLCNIGVVE